MDDKLTKKDAIFFVVFALALIAITLSFLFNMPAQQENSDCIPCEQELELMDY